MTDLIVRNKIPPTRHMQYCCRELKQCFGKGRVKLTGIRGGESFGRRRRPLVDTRKDGTVHVNPVLKWTTADIWQFIRENNIPYCPLYDEGFTRVGCVLCPNQTRLQTLRDLQRFPDIVGYYKRACQLSFDANREHFAQSKRKSADWQSGDDMFSWWINQRHPTRRAAPNSVSLFEEV